MPFWASDSRATPSTEDLAAWLRDVGGDGRLGEPFGSDIDASWLGRASRRPRTWPTAPDVGGADAAADGDGPLEAGA